MIGEKVLVLAERIKKKAAPGKFYKQSVKNVSYFNQERTFTIRKIQPIDSIKYYWLKDAKNNKKLTKRFQRTELSAKLRAILLCMRMFILLLYIIHV